MSVYITKYKLWTLSFCFLILTFCKTSSTSSSGAISAYAVRGTYRWCIDYESNSNEITNKELEYYRQVAVAQDQSDIVLENKELNQAIKAVYTFGNGCQKDKYLGACKLGMHDNKIWQIIYTHEEKSSLCRDKNGEWINLNN
jgi:hypothetical protein